MSVVTRKFSASPKRTAAETWSAVVEAVAHNQDSIKEKLNSAIGVAATVISESTPSSSPIVITGSGSRLKVYCLYGEDAVLGEDADESILSWNLFDVSDWKVNFPAEESDIEVFEKILKDKGDHFEVYKVGESIKEGESPPSPAPQLTIDVEKLKKHV